MDRELMSAKAVGMLSGGLDSTLAVRLILDQGFEVEALNYVTPVRNCNRSGRCEAKEVAGAFSIPCRTIAITDEISQVIREPKHGYGSGMNPCLDCRILMFSHVRKRMEETGAAFVFTGEVLGQRPMSQQRQVLRIIERESGLEGRLLRPLSARLLESTIPKQDGLIDRGKLLALQGRSRKPQMALAEERGVADYPCSAGGCLLTHPAFARRIRDLMRFRPGFDLGDVNLLKVGRHFRLAPGAKSIVGRNIDENLRLLRVARQGDLLFEVKGYGSPVTLLHGEAGPASVYLAAAITARYSDALVGEVEVHHGTDHAAFSSVVLVTPAGKVELAALRILKRRGRTCNVKKDRVAPLRPVGHRRHRYPGQRLGLCPMVGR
jgi:tRNA-specific 2-thiouridylase